MDPSYPASSSKLNGESTYDFVSVEIQPCHKRSAALRLRPERQPAGCHSPAHLLQWCGPAEHLQAQQRKKCQMTVSSWHPKDAFDARPTQNVRHDITNFGRRIIVVSNSLASHRFSPLSIQRVRAWREVNLCGAQRADRKKLSDFEALPVLERLNAPEPQLLINGSRASRPFPCSRRACSALSHSRRSGRPTFCPSSR